LTSVVIAILILIGGVSIKDHIRTPTSLASDPPTPSESPGTTYYVAPDGRDDNPGTLSRPWATLQHAADTMAPGDTVYVRGGIYHQRVALTRSGTVEQPITYAAYPGETVWLDGQGVDWKYAFDLGNPGVSHIVIDGLNMRHWHDSTGDGACVIAWSESDDVVIRHLELHHCGHGGISFFQNSDDILVEDVVSHDNTLVGIDCGIGPCRRWILRRVRALDNGTGESDTAADGIAVESGDDILVEDCEASGNSGDGFDFKSTGTRLHRIVARDNGRNNIKLWGQRSSLRNGLAVDSGLTSLVLSGGGSYTVTNTLIANRRSYGYLAEFGADNDQVTPVRLYNTIFYNDDSQMGGTTAYFSTGVHLQADHNLYYNPYRENDVICAYFLGAGEEACFTSEQIKDGTWFVRSGQGERSLYADPVFVDAAGKDFHLSADSPAVDAGTSVWAPDEDLEGYPRPTGSVPDLGPYEYQVRVYLPLALAQAGLTENRWESFDRGYCRIE
jgi:hypothetical protein